MEQESAWSIKVKKIKKILVIIAEIILLYFVLEMVAMYYSVQSKSPFRPNAYYLYQPRPNLSNYHFLSKDGSTTNSIVSTNRDGFRSPGATTRKPAGIFRIMCMGDSVTFGSIKTNNDTTYPYFLEGALRSRHPGKKIEVINAGCPGHTCVQGMEILRRVGLKYKPDLLVIGYIHHEIMYSMCSDRERLDSPEVIKFIKSILYHSNFYCWLKGSGANEQASPDRFSSVVRVPLEEYRKTMLEFVSIAQAKDMRIIFLILPSNDERGDSTRKGYFQALCDISNQSGALLLNVNSVIKNYTRTSGISVMEDYMHPNKEGNMIMAEYIADSVDHVIRDKQESH